MRLILYVEAAILKKTWFIESLLYTRRIFHIKYRIFNL